MILELQKLFLSVSPGLLPLLAFPLSMAQAWHCTIMCGPGYAMKTVTEKRAYLQGRLLSYVLAGVLFGALGEALRESLEAQVLGFLAFVIFVFFALSLALGFSTLPLALPDLRFGRFIQLCGWWFFNRSGSCSRLDVSTVGRGCRLSLIAKAFSPSR
jgi:hypothetical protein